MTSTYVHGNRSQRKPAVLSKPEPNAAFGASESGIRVSHTSIRPETGYTGL